MSAAQPWSQEEILAAAVASLTEADIPPDQDDPGRSADPDYDRPDELADLMTPELEQLIAEPPAPAPAFGPAGFLPRDGPGHGAGSTACDLDHTRAYDDDGWTCECNLAPLCRRHHRAKQAQGWRLTQPQPGVLIWTTPSGRVYSAQPATYQ